MKFKSIYLQDFRQYSGKQNIYFSTDPERNITLILGANLTGKTTLIQAFYWCFYGDLDLPDKFDLPNRQKVKSLNIGESIKTIVKIKFTHDDVDYSISREWEYKKISETIDGESGLDRRPIKKLIFTKIIKGVTTDVSEKDINKIFPYDLSRYFLFDGERLKNMMSQGKNDDVSKAVKTILGLGLLEDTIRHLNRVQKQFYEEREKYSQNNSEYSSKYKRKKEITSCIEELENDISNSENSINKCESRIKNLEMELENLEIVRQDQIRIKQIENSLNNLKNIDLEKYRDKLKKNFNDNFISYLISKVSSVYKDSLNIESKNRSTISGLHGSAIREIISKGECICGTKIIENSKEHKSLLEQIKYQPPAAAAVIATSFTEKTKLYQKLGNVFIQDFTSTSISIDDLEILIEDLNDELGILRKKVSSFEDADKLQENKDKVIFEKGKLKTHIEDSKNQISELNIELETLDKELTRLSQANSQDALLAKREEYCIEIIKTLDKFYASKESTIHKKLSHEVQSIFTKIIGTKHKIYIDRDYSYTVTNETGVNAISTGGDVMVAISFISGIIKVAKENDKKLMKNEPYPLVLDAPFSNLDPERKITTGAVIPEIAEQLILISFDDLEGAMNARIGNKYKLNLREEEFTEIERIV